MSIRLPGHSQLDVNGVFMKNPHIEPQGDKQSASFGKFDAQNGMVQKISLDKSEALTFGNRPDIISRSNVGSNELSPQEYTTFKKNSRYNEMVNNTKKKPQEKPQPVDKSAQQILKIDDVGEVGEWAGVSLNKNRRQDDGEDGPDMSFKKDSMDDEFDFEAKPNASGNNHHQTQNEKENMDRLRLKAQQKLEKGGLKIGGGLGGLSNKLALKQKELQINGGLNTNKDEKQDLLNKGKAGVHSPGDKRSVGDTVGNSNGVNNNLIHKEGSVRDSPKLDHNGAKNTNKVPAKKMDLNFSWGGDDDEWNNANKVNMGSPDNVMQTEPVAGFSWRDAWLVLKNQNYATEKHLVVLEEPKSFMQKMLGCLSTGLDERRKKEKEIVYCIAKVNYDPQVTMHRGLLQEVYTFLTGSDICPKIGTHWRQIGFQTEDPNRDFRSSGLLGVLQLSSIIERHPEWVKTIYELSLDETHGFPLAISQFSFTLLCLEIFRSSKMNNFINSRPDFITAFDDLYCGITAYFYSKYKAELITKHTFGVFQQKIEGEVKANPVLLAKRYLTVSTSVKLPEHEITISAT